MHGPSLPFAFLDPRWIWMEFCKKRKKSSLTGTSMIHSASPQSRPAVIVVGFWSFGTDGRTDKRTTCAKLVITSGWNCGRLVDQYFFNSWTQKGHQRQLEIKLFKIGWRNNAVGSTIWSYAKYALKSVNFFFLWTCRINYIMKN